MLRVLFLIAAGICCSTVLSVDISGDTCGGRWPPLKPRSAAPLPLACIARVLTVCRLFSMLAALKSEGSW